MPIDLSEALEFHRRAKYELAGKVYQAALDEDPDRHEAMHLLGLIELERGNLPRAFLLIRHAITLHPSQAAYRASLAEAHWANREPDAAVDCLRTAVRIDPGHPDILCNLGASLVDGGDIDGGIEHFCAALQLDPNLAAAHNNLGNALQRKGDKTLALEHFRTSVRLDPKAAEAHSNIGNILGSEADLSKFDRPMEGLRILSCTTLQRS